MSILPFRRTDTQTDDEMILASVDRNLLRSVSNTKLLQARERALNAFHSGVQMNMAIRRAVSWALCTADEGPKASA